MKAIIVIIMMSLVFGCAADTDMTRLDPARYPLRVRQGDIIDKIIFDQTWMPYSDMHKRTFGADYVDPRAADAWVKDYVAKTQQQRRSVMNTPLYIMKADKIAGRTLDMMERFFDSRRLKRAIWAVLILAVIYFIPVIYNIINR